MLGLGEKQTKVLEEPDPLMLWGLDCSQAAALFVPLPGTDQQDSSCRLGQASPLPSGPIALPLALLTAMPQGLEEQTGAGG